MSDVPEVSDEKLAAAAQRGDAAAFDLLVRRYLRRAMAIAWQHLRELSDAEDAVQEAFHRVVRALPTYDPQREFGPWFYTIVRNVAKNARSKQGRRRELHPTESLSSIEHGESWQGASPDPAAASELESALASLPSMQEACLRLCEIEGYTSAEAGRMLGIREGTVRSHLHRARRALRDMVSAVKETA